MIPQFNSIVLDVIVVLLLAVIAVFGALKGIKHVSLNFLLLAGSIALAFSPLTDIIKLFVIDLLSKYIQLGAGVSDAARFGVYFSYKFFSALVLTLVLYLLLRLFKYLIVVLVRKRAIKNNKLPSPTSVVSRVFGGIVNFLFGGVIFIVGLSILNTPVIGLNKTMENGYVAKHIANVDDLILDNYVEDKLIEEKVIIKILFGDLFMEVDNDSAKALKGISGFMNDATLVPSSLENIQQNLDAIHDLLLLVDTYAIDEAGSPKDGLEQVVYLTKDLMNKVINQMNELHKSEEPIEATGTLAISNLLTKLGLKESVEIFENIFVIH